MADEIKDKRRGFLETLLGPLASKTRGDLQKAQALLDEAGVARKAEGEVEAPPETTEEVPSEPPDLEKLARTTASGLLVALGDMMGTATEDQITAALVSIWGMPPDESAAPPAEEGEEQIMESKEQKQAALDSEERKAFTETLTAMTKDMGAIADIYRATAEREQKRDEAQKSILDAVGALVKQVSALEEKVNGRPRIASQASETTIDPTSEAARAIQSAAEKGVNGQKKIFGGIQLKD